MKPPTHTPSPTEKRRADPSRTLVWPHGQATLQRLGAMLAPVVFRAAGHADFAPMQVAPWADEPGSAALPGILQRLRGEWPCVPFGPLELRYVDRHWTLQLDWDRTLLPDLMLWVSHRGRTAAPWNGRHWALGVEPVNGVFDLGRVTTPPSGHASARHAGVSLHPDWPCTLHYRLQARPDL